MNFKHLSTLLLACVIGLASATTAWAHGDSGDKKVPDSAAYGVPGEPSQVRRTIKLEASDAMRFSKANIKVRKGETIRFVITNVGRVRHEFSLGTQQELIEHYALMKKFPDMVHEEANKVTMDPGQTGEVVWKFTQPGVVDFACLHPGHFDAGMKGQIQVSN
jgi:uncharacterized cupredoxin-like copper-binding protein